LRSRFWDCRHVPHPFMRCGQPGWRIQVFAAPRLPDAAGTRFCLRADDFTIYSGTDSPGRCRPEASCETPSAFHRRAQRNASRHRRAEFPAQRFFQFSKFCSLNSWIQTARSNSKNAVSFSSERAMKRFPSSRCASTIHIVRPSRLAEVVCD
jgi:hypothetical protein